MQADTQPVDLPLSSTELLVLNTFVLSRVDTCIPYFIQACHSSQLLVTLH